ncbi:MAG: hypothetical protein OXI80_05390 [Caldilineaceae bacterium]|nr:hypothetical protein [Caldilineaceae bacterium]MDE0337081.1 hypothetical protein [Caldilineaceae bacterium]
MWTVGPGLILLMVVSLLPARTAKSQETLPASYTFEECVQVDEASLRDELNDITQAVFAKGRSEIIVNNVVERKWQDLGMDAKVDLEVDRAVELIREDTPFWERIWSAWSPSAAEELAVRIAEEAFGSDSLKSDFDDLSEVIANEIADELRLVTAESASSALVCVQEFIGDRFSNTMVQVLDKQIQDDLKIAISRTDTDTSFIDVFRTHADLAGGIAVIVGTRIGVGIAKKLATTLSSNLVTRIAARILTRTLAGVIPIVGWIIGGVLIVTDLVGSRDGALPFIRDSLQSEEAKAEMKEWIAEEVSEELRTESPLLARDIANSTFRKWQDFREKFSRVLDLAEELPRFKSILDRTEVDKVAKLAELVHLVEEKEPEQLNMLIQSGRFEFIQSLPEEALEILRVTGESSQLISWGEFAEELIEQVVETELYLVASPKDFTDRVELQRVLALGAKELIQKLMLLDSETRDALLGLTTAHTQQLVDEYTTEDLTWLVKAYLTSLDAQRRNILIDRLLRQPELITELRKELVQKTLLESQDFTQALNYIATNSQERPIFDQIRDMLSQVRPAVSGELPWALFWHYEGAVLRVAILAIVGLVTLSILWRMVFSRRLRQDVGVTVVLPESRTGSSSDPAPKESESNKQDGSP